MKFFVAITSAALAASAGADPLTPGYGAPVAAPIAPAPGVVEVVPVPVEDINLPANVPFIEPPFLRAAVAPRALPVPLAPSPVRLLSQRARGLPVALPRGLPVAPAALPRGLPVAPAALPRGLPVAPAALPRGLPVAPAALPRAVPVAPIPAGPVASQYHAQDELGGYSYGYANQHSAKQESRRPDGVTVGSYSYVDAYGLPQKVDYVADALGFRVRATNLPVGPAPVGAVPVAAAAGPLPVPAAIL